MKKNSSYHGIEPTQAMLDAVLVQNSQSTWFRFILWEERIFIMDRQLEFRNWQDFHDGWTEEDAFNEEDGELRSMYIAKFGTPPPKNAKFVSISKAVWCKLYLLAEDRTGIYSGRPKDPVTGKAERRRNLNGREYRVLETYEGWTKDLPAQAQVVYHGMVELTVQAESEIITEGAVKDLMMRLRDSGTLKTKQDPFRIFQYYRSALKKANLIE